MHAEVRGVFGCKQWAGAAVGELCLIANPLRGGRRPEKRLNHLLFVLSTPSLHCISPLFPASLRIFRIGGVWVFSLRVWTLLQRDFVAAFS